MNSNETAIEFLKLAAGAIGSAMALDSDIELEEVLVEIKSIVNGRQCFAEAPGAFCWPTQVTFENHIYDFDDNGDYHRQSLGKYVRGDFTIFVRADGLVVKEITT